MKVRDVMKTDVVTVTPETTYEEAARILHERGFSGLPVMDRGELVGMISEKDLLRGMYPNAHEFAENPAAFLNREALENRVEDIRKNPISHYMHWKVISVRPDAPVLEAAGIMLSHHVHRLPVIEGGKLVGIVTRDIIFNAILEHHLTS